MAKSKLILSSALFIIHHSDFNLLVESFLFGLYYSIDVTNLP